MTLVDAGLVPAPRAFERLAVPEAEASHARIWQGVLFRDAMEDGCPLVRRPARRVPHLLR